MHTDNDATMRSATGRAGRSRGLRTALVALAALALVTTACGKGSDKDAGKDSGQAPAQGAPAGAPEAEFLQLKGVSTSLDLDPSTAAVLQQNKVTVSPVEPATASMTGSTTTVSFPITEGYVSVYSQSQTPFIRGTFSHSGGVTFKAGAKSLTATDFVVNPGSSTLTATVGGKGVQLLDLDGTNVKVSKDAQGQTKLEGTVAKLSSAAAAALNQTFGVSIFQQGIPLGTVRIAATGTAGPGGAPQAELKQLKGVSTNVDLDPSTAAVLQQNKVTVGPVGPATASMNGSTTTVSFPITEGYVSVYPQAQAPFIRGTFSHSGGITFKAGGKSPWPSSPQPQPTPSTRPSASRSSSRASRSAPCGSKPARPHRARRRRPPARLPPAQQHRVPHPPARRPHRRPPRRRRLRPAAWRPAAGGPPEAARDRCRSCPWSWHRQR